MIAVHAPEKFSLLLRHLAEQFFEDTHCRDYEIRAQLDEKSARVQINGVSGEFSLHQEDASPHALNKLMIGRAFAEAARKSGCPIPSYGILTGVRPVKPAANYLALYGEEAVDRLREDYLAEEKKARVLTDLARIELDLKAKLKPRDVLLYISIPFCPSRCAYCSFISSAAPKHLDSLDSYLRQLEEELKTIAALCQKHGLRIVGVYMGGGTPGILSAAQLDGLMGLLRERFDLEKSEISVELGRPDTVTEEKLEILKARGVHRLSINTQTTNDEILRAIGRTHSAEEFFGAFRLAKGFGFDSLNADLIAGLPGESAESFRRSVREVLALEPENLTVHSFCLKKSAATRHFTLCDRKTAAEMLDFSFESCINAGLKPYYLYRQKNAAGALENTGFSRAGKECLYNIAMMEDLIPVLAAGAGGISKLPGKRDADKITRLAQFKYPFEYLAHPEKTAANLELLDELIQNYYTE